MNFHKQKTTARRAYINNKFKHEGNGRSIFDRRGSVSDIKRTINDKSFAKFADKAYSAKRGYAIRTNPRTKEKEMFVRGTTFKRFGAEWAQNLAEAPVIPRMGLGGTIAGDVSRHFRRQYSKFLSDVAQKNNVSVVYGHSRGGAIVEDMNTRAKKVGVDAATILNSRSTLTNYRQRQFFDALIGANSASTVTSDRWIPIWDKRYHRFYKAK